MSIIHISQSYHSIQQSLYIITRMLFKCVCIYMFIPQSLLPGNEEEGVTAFQLLEKARARVRERERERRREREEEEEEEKEKQEQEEAWGPFVFSYNRPQETI